MSFLHHCKVANAKVVFGLTSLTLLRNCRGPFLEHGFINIKVGRVGVGNLRIYPLEAVKTSLSY